MVEEDSQALPVAQQLESEQAKEDIKTIPTDDSVAVESGEEEMPSRSRSLAVLIEKEQKTEGNPPAIDDVRAIEIDKKLGHRQEEQSVPLVEESKKAPPIHLGSFKEESNKIDELSDSERISLYELKRLVQEEINANRFAAAEGNPDESRESKPSIWGIPLLVDDRSDVVLLKFLRARDFKVNDALSMIKDTILWRAREGIDQIVSEELDEDWGHVVFMHGVDRQGHPVCYNVYGEFQNKELYQKAFATEEKRVNFLKWRVQFLEKTIRKLDFNPGGVSTIFHVNDLKNSPGPGKRELRMVAKRALLILQDNYPEFVAKQVFINVPWWYIAFYTMLNPFLTQRMKSKFVFASPARTPDALFKYIAPQQVPVQYGGLSVDSCDCNPEFTINDEATEITIKPGTKQTVEIIIYEQCEIVWELRVVGWEVTYSAEFVPDEKEAYPSILQRPIKKSSSDAPIESSSFKVSELGKIWLIVDNPSSKKKKLFYRYKVKPFPN